MSNFLRPRATVAAVSDSFVKPHGTSDDSWPEGRWCLSDTYRWNDVEVSEGNSPRGSDRGGQDGVGAAKTKAATPEVRWLNLEETGRHYRAEKERRIWLRRYFIYALLDPRSSRVRYIGCTGDLAHRFSMHVSTCRRTANTKLGAWVRSLKSRKQRPILRVLTETVGLPDALDAEQRWVNAGFRRGWRLFNRRTTNFGSLGPYSLRRIGGVQ